MSPWTAENQASLSVTNSQRLLKLMSIESVMPSNHLTMSSPSPPAFNLSQLQGLSNESAKLVKEKKKGDEIRNVTGVVGRVRRFPWWSRGLDSVLLMQEGQVPSWPGN